jgi:hypothetical protein
MSRLRRTDMRLRPNTETIIQTDRTFTWPS